MLLCLASVIFGTCCYHMTYHNEARTHLSLDKDAPIPREVQSVGWIRVKPHLGGLHNHRI